MQLFKLHESTKCWIKCINIFRSRCFLASSRWKIYYRIKVFSPRQFLNSLFLSKKRLCTLLEACKLRWSKKFKVSIVVCHMLNTLYAATLSNTTNDTCVLDKVESLQCFAWNELLVKKKKAKYKQINNKNKQT